MIEARREYSAEAMPLARDGELAGLEQVMRDSYGRIWDQMTPRGAGHRGRSRHLRGPQVDAAAARSYTSDWFRSFLAYDPTPTGSA